MSGGRGHCGAGPSALVVACDAIVVPDRFETQPLDAF
jgi:hypothetical protein